MSGRSTLVTILIVLVAVVAAWFLVGLLWKAVLLAVRLAVVAAVALVIYVLIRRALSERG